MFVLAIAYGDVRWTYRYTRQCVGPGSIPGISTNNGKTKKELRFSRGSFFILLVVPNTLVTCILSKLENFFNH